jgi:hypothetical protein
MRPDGGEPRQGFGNLDKLAAFLLRLQDEDGFAEPVDATARMMDRAEQCMTKPTDRCIQWTKQRRHAWRLR